MKGTLDDILRSITTNAKPTLDLSHYKLDDDGARKIAHFLVGDKFVKKLSIPWNVVWPDGAKALAEAISSNSSLEVIDMGHNSIQSEGAEYLAEALKVNRTLRVMNLSDNNITDKGVESLLRSLEENRTLQKLEIEGNPIFDRELKMKVQAQLQSNFHQKRVTLVQEVAAPANDFLLDTLRKELEELKLQNKNLKKKLDKVTSEHNALKNRFTAQETSNNNLLAQLETSIQSLIALEKTVSGISSKLEKEKSKAAELAEAQQAREALLKECTELRDRTNALNIERRTLRINNEALTKRVALLSGDVDAYEHLEFQLLVGLEDQVEAALKALRTVKVHRLQRKLDEAQDARKCKVCFEGAVNSVLVPCGHHILCQACSLKVTKCPLCTTAIQNRIHTFEC